MEADYADGTINADWRPAGGDPATAMNEGWPGIGATSIANADIPLRFTARFEGNGNTISNLYRRASGNSGLFNTTERSALIANVGLVDGALYGGDGNGVIGMLVGYNIGMITGSYATGTVTGGNGIDSVGGLVGRSDTNATITGSYATATVSGGNGNDSVGGLAGLNFGSIFASHATGAVNGNDGTDNTGGLAGFASGTIGGSYATGAVNGDDDADNVGGLVGNSGANTSGCYATGQVNGGSGADNVGGLAGRTAAQIIAATYATGNVHGDGDDDNVGGLVGIRSTNNSRGIDANYTTGDVDGGEGSDNVGAILGHNEISHLPTNSYGFGSVTGETEYDDIELPTGFSATDPTALQISNAGMSSTYVGDNWNNNNTHSTNAWNFGNSSQTPALRYADYDGGALDTFECSDSDSDYPATIPGTDTAIICNTTLLPGQGR